MAEFLLQHGGHKRPVWRQAMEGSPGATTKIIAAGSKYGTIEN